MWVVLAIAPSCRPYQVGEARSAAAVVERLRGMTLPGPEWFVALTEADGMTVGPSRASALAGPVDVHGAAAPSVEVCT